MRRLQSPLRVRSYSNYIPMAQSGSTTEVLVLGSACTGWERLDNNPGTVAIAPAGTHIDQRHNDGSIWRYKGPRCTGAMPWLGIDR
jgi:hypothetical protein